MARFETIFITRPDLDDESRKALNEKLRNIVQERKGTVHVEDDWGKQRLAYEIKKQIKGYYTYLGFEGTGELQREVERLLRLNESVIKFQTCSVKGEFEHALTQLDRTRPPQGRRGRSGGPGDQFGRSFDDGDQDGMGGGGGKRGEPFGKRDSGFEDGPVGPVGFADDLDDKEAVE